MFIQIQLKFVPKGAVNNKQALVQRMAWCWTGHKPLSEPMMSKFTDAYVLLGLNKLMDINQTMTKKSIRNYLMY